MVDGKREPDSDYNLTEESVEFADRSLMRKKEERRVRNDSKDFDLNNPEKFIFSLVRLGRV